MSERPPYGSYAASTGRVRAGLGAAGVVGTWAAAGLAVTQLLAPRFGRLLTWSLSAAAFNDFSRRASPP